MPEPMPECFMDTLEAFAEVNRRREIEELRSRTREESIRIMDILLRAWLAHPDPRWSRWADRPCSLDILIERAGGGTVG